LVSDSRILKGMTMVQLSWVVRADNGAWLDLPYADLSNVATEGVYVIWMPIQGRNVVRVGQGKIAQRVSAHRKDQEIIAHGQSGVLKVTWAAVSAEYRDGVERYLADQLNPLVGDAFPDVLPIAVNLPGK
jgi:hypothetical protein